jgi:hypothetical protein
MSGRALSKVLQWVCHKREATQRLLECIFGRLKKSEMIPMFVK